MPDPDPVDQSLAELSKFFVGDKTMLDTLDRVATLAVEAIEAAEFCGLTMLLDGEIGTGVFTDPEAPEIDKAQYESGSGPCLDSFRTGEILRIESTADDGPWPEFRRACLQHGIMSTASFPMLIDDVRHGALNMYSRQESAFGSAEVVAGRHFAAQAGVVIAYARSYWNALELSRNLQAAMAHRAEIEQAKGVIIGTTGATADEAFDVLVKQSQHENRKVRDIAAELVASKVRRPVRPPAAPTPTPDHDDGDSPAIKVGQRWVAKTNDGDVAAITIIGTADGDAEWTVQTSNGQPRPLTTSQIITGYRLV
jgi:GAF domain-containing protein